MKKYRYFLLPISAILWFSLAEFSVKMLYLLSLEIDFENIIYVVTTNGVGIFGLIFYLIFLMWLSKRLFLFYNSSKVSIITHSVSGLGGLIAGYFRIVKDLFIETHDVFSNTTDFIRMWTDSPLLTIIFLTVSVIVAIICFLGFVIVPFSGNQIEITS